MCTKEEVQSIVNASNKTIGVHLSYIKKAVEDSKKSSDNTNRDNKKSHSEIITKMEAYVESMDKRYATNERVKKVEISMTNVDEKYASNQRVDSLEKTFTKSFDRLSSIMFWAVTTLIANLLAVIFLFINHYM